jgi:hypothetical protein
MSNYSFGQKPTFFKVEFDKFSPPIKGMIDAAEGKLAKNFRMKDLRGNEVSLAGLKGNKIVLWFWDNDMLSTSLLNSLIPLAGQYGKVKFLGLYNQEKISLDNTYSTFENVFILPNAAFLGDAVYDSELGTPRIYLIDEKNIVKMVIPKSYMGNILDVMVVIDNFINNKIH